MSQRETYYDVLGVSPRAGFEQIQGRYRELAQRHRPDPTDGEALATFQRITRAYHTLQDPTQRADYDRSLEVKRGGGAPAGVLRSSAMQRLLSEAEGDALAEAGERAEALAAYRSALGGAANPALEAKIARLQNAAAPGAERQAPEPSPEPPAQPFWRRWLGQSRAAG